MCAERLWVSVWGDGAAIIQPVETGDAVRSCRRIGSSLQSGPGHTELHWHQNNSSLKNCFHVIMWQNHHLINTEQLHTHTHTHTHTLLWVQFKHTHTMSLCSSAHIWTWLSRFHKKTTVWISDHTHTHTHTHIHTLRHTHTHTHTHHAWWEIHTVLS